MDGEEYRHTDIEEYRSAAAGNGRKRHPFFNGWTVGLLLILVIVGGMFLGIGLDRFWAVKSGRMPSGGKYGTAVSAGTIRKMQTVEQIIRQSYYRDEDIGEEELEAGIYRGMVESLGDVYSDYYTSEELSELLQQTQGIYYGIGAAVALDEETSYPKIQKIYNGTPSQEAGLRENDIIYEVEGENTYGLDLSEVVDRIKGEEGTYVNLTVVREGEEDYLSIDVQRRQVNTPTVESEMFEGKAAYIQITEFDDVTVDQFKEAMAEARAKGMKGLILDLRSNPGGSLDSVVEICQNILPEGLIVYTEDKYGKRMEYSCDGTRCLEVPLVVLVNGNSASAAEIMAGAIKDYGLGVLVGTRTFGKGIVQSIIPLSDGSAVKLTVSSYFTPKGNNIHGLGIEPDEECIFDGEAYYGSPDRPDNQLEKAKEVLAGLMGE